MLYIYSWCFVLLIEKTEGREWQGSSIASCWMGKAQRTMGLFWQDERAGDEAEHFIFGTQTRAAKAKANFQGFWQVKANREDLVRQAKSEAASETLVCSVDGLLAACRCRT